MGVHLMRVFSALGATGLLTVPHAITVGPDGALWFTNEGNSSIGRITTGGTVTSFTSSGAGIADPNGITTGPDGALWFTNFEYSIGRITTAGKVSSYSSHGIGDPGGIVAGPDGRLWFTNSPSLTSASSSIGRMATDGTERNFTGPIAVFGGVYEYGLTAGPDGAMWFINADRRSIGRITVNGKAASFPVPGPSNPQGITSGPDGAIWFTEGPKASAIGRITTTGKVTTFTDPRLHNPRAITRGPDGALWFVNSGASPSAGIGRITTAGTVTIFKDRAVGFASDIVAGPDGALWFADSAINLIGRVTTSVTPGISDKNPESGPVGTQVTITGVNLGGATAVAFSGTPAQMITDSATTVVTRVPSGATTGLITVTTPAGTATTKHDFVITP